MCSRHADVLSCRAIGDVTSYTRRPVPDYVHFHKVCFQSIAAPVSVCYASSPGKRSLFGLCFTLICAHHVDDACASNRSDFS